MDKKEVTDTINDAREYMKRLKNLNDELHYAEQQITSTANEAERNIHAVFSNLLNEITLALGSRRDDLINQSKKIQHDGLVPFEECKKVVSQNITNTVNLVKLGSNLLNRQNGAEVCLEEFRKKSSLLGSLPEVPPLKEVPYISFQYELGIEKDLINSCSNFGSVIHIAPVQISSLTEKPGAILVEWNTSEADDHILDIQQYELQRAFGDLSTEKYLKENFRTFYTGPDNQYLVKDLIQHQTYTFRVRCKFEGEAEWSPWSLPQVYATNLKPFSWSDNENFILTNDNKIATPISHASSILFSDRIEFNAGYSVEFTFLEYDESNLNDTFVGLFLQDDIRDFKVKDTECVCVEANGNIYGSGLKKSTQFSPVGKGTKICFSCDSINQSKIRINIDSCGRRVTYDWSVKQTFIYFGAILTSTRWKVMID